MLSSARSARRARVALEQDVAGALRIDAEDHVGDGRFSGTGLADDGQALALFDIEGDIIDRPHGAAWLVVKVLETERRDGSGRVIESPLRLTETLMHHQRREIAFRCVLDLGNAAAGDARHGLQKRPRIGMARVVEQPRP